MQLMSNCNRSDKEFVAPADKSLDFLATLLLFVTKQISQWGKSLFYLQRDITVFSV